jgi:hypothetical protein
MPGHHFKHAVLLVLPLVAVLASRALAQPTEKPATLDHETVLRLLHQENPAEVQRAAESVFKAQPKDREELEAVAEAVKAALSTTRNADTEATLRLALGKLAAAGVKDSAEWALETAEWGFESMSVTHGPKTTRKVFDGHVRALEMVPGAAKELMIGNLDVALNFPEADPKERQRLKEFVTLTAEAMRTRELAEFLDALLLGEDDLFVKIEAPLEVRLIACYQKVRVDPPINADAVVTWLEKHPGGPAEVEIAALETIALIGTSKPDAATKLADRLLASPQNAEVLARRLLSGHLHRSLLKQVKAAVRRHAAGGQHAELTALLAELDKLQP